MTGVEGTPRMMCVAPLLSALYPDEVTGGLILLLHGGAHAHMSPGPVATDLARVFALHGPFSVAPPHLCSNRSCVPHGWLWRMRTLLPRRTIVRLQLNAKLEPYITIEDPNTEILAPTEPYSTNYNARRAAESLKRRLRRAVIIDEIGVVR